MDLDDNVQDVMVQEKYQQMKIKEVLTMKKTYMIGIIAILCVGIAFGVVEGYKLLTATSHFSTIEGIELQYFETADGQWHDLPANGSLVNFGIANIKPGETTTFYVRGRNTAASGALDLIVVLDDSNYLTHSLVCNQTGVAYTQAGNTYHIKTIAGAGYQAVGFSTTADGMMPIVSTDFNNTVYRANVLVGYENVCP